MMSSKVFYGVIAMIMISKSIAQESEYGHEEYGYPKYTFEYQVNDDHTKDIKTQHETRDGHAVKGFYSLLQPDGKTRIVQYTADEKTGFNAEVKYEGGSYEYSAPASSAAPATESKYQYLGSSFESNSAPSFESAPAASFESAPAASYGHSSFSKASVSTPHFSYSY